MEKPFFVKALEKADPEMLKHMTAMSDFAGKDGAIPAKMKTLMSMLGDAILGHPNGVKALADRARTQGASEQEIAETVRMAFFCAGMPGLVTGTYAFRRS